MPIAIFVLLMLYVDIFWLTQPPTAHHLAHHFTEHGDTEMAHYYHEHIPFGLGDILNLVGFAGLFMGLFGISMAKSPLVPVNDPRLQESLAHENL